MESQTKQCQNCKKDFTIEPEDFAFYEKMKVPAPTWCPECRMQRRFAWRNERVLYKRKCDMCGKSTVTIYSPDKPYKVYCPTCWWSDKWSALDFGVDFNFERPFFEQFYDLQLKVPRIALLTKNSINSDYTNHSNNNKNCYLSYSTFNSENVMYSTTVMEPSHNICDCCYIQNGGGGQLIYQLLFSGRCYRCQYSILLRDCTDCFYCYDCHGCSDCFLSCNLRNKQYYFRNKQYTKEEYFEKIHEYNLESFKVRTDLFVLYLDLIKNIAVHRFAVIENSTNVSGDNIFNSKNTFRSFSVYELENAKFVIESTDTKDVMDSGYQGLNSELVYESHALIHSYNVLFTNLSYDNSEIQYCDSCHNNQNLFGCIGLKAQNYCILNKRYTKDEYEKIRLKIIGHMMETKEYGEFFPPKLSPFGYNETQGNIYMPLNEDQALRLGYKWEDCLPGTFGKETVKSEEIPDVISEIGDAILKEILCCDECKKNYNIVSQELDFYRHEHIPVPRLCPDCRYRNRIKLLPPRKLWHRHCMKPGCTNEFETSYAPDRPEIVYCEQCYQQEVA